MADEKKLTQLRIDIDAVDKQLIDLISDRARLAQAVAEVKNESTRSGQLLSPGA